MEKTMKYLIMSLLCMMIVCGCAQLDKTPILEETCIPTPLPTSTGVPTTVPTSTYIPTRLPEDLRNQIMDAYLAEVEPILNEWNATIEKTNEVRSISPLDDLIRLRDEFAFIEIDPYLENLHGKMIQHMDCQIASYLVLIGKEGVYMMDLDVEPSSYFENCSSELR